MRLRDERSWHRVPDPRSGRRPLIGRAPRPKLDISQERCTRSGTPEIIDTDFRRYSAPMGQVIKTYEDAWQPARLLSTIGLRGEEERERRGTSALLAVMMAVPEFGQEIVSSIGGPKGRISTFTEIQLKESSGKRCIPDGAIICERGKNKWCALVEVKTGTAKLQSDQVSKYLDLARDNGFDAVLTISNQITAKRTDHAVVVDKRKLKSVNLLHISWWRILTAAIVQFRHKGVSDPDQAWILGELIAYLDNDRSGASGFQGMGDNWVSVRDAAAQRTLRASDKGASDVAHRWDQFLDYLALSLTQDLGREVSPVRDRKSTPEERYAAYVKEMTATGSLSGSIKVPDAIAPIQITVDLRAKVVETSISVKAPTTGRAQTKINWILRQLKNAPTDLRIDARFANTRETTSEMLVRAREDSAPLLFPNDTKRDPRFFDLALARKMGLKRGIDAGSFSRETRRQLVIFYRDLVQDLKAWQTPPPSYPDEPSALDAESVNADAVAMPVSSTESVTSNSTSALNADASITHLGAQSRILQPDANPLDSEQNAETPGEPGGDQSLPLHRD
ncbi:MAG: hypothetical protein WAP35_00485 [Solirubrobacterales bacterium]